MRHRRPTAGAHLQQGADAASCRGLQLTGFYVGVNGGGGWGRTDWFFNVVGTTANHDSSGGLAGGQIGYNWQTGPWVFGVEADGDWANINGSTP